MTELEPTELCPHPALIKVIDRLGMMTSTHTQQGQVVSAPVLESHYECRVCGVVVMRNANPEAIRAYEEFYTATEKLVAAADAVDGARQALTRRKKSHER